MFKLTAQNQPFTNSYVQTPRGVLLFCSQTLTVKTIETLSLKSLDQMQKETYILVLPVYSIIFHMLMFCNHF